MSQVKFKVYDTPDNNGKSNGLCARVISSGTKRDKEIYKFINDCCSVTSSDIKGVLEGLTVYIETMLSYGYSVELEGLGYFSPAVRTEKETNTKGKEVYRVKMDGVNFRCSTRLRETLKQAKPEKIKRDNQAKSTLEERKNKMLAYLQTHLYMSAAEYTRQNACTSYRADLDIKQFLKEGVIKAEGCSTHKIYMRA